LEAVQWAKRRIVCFCSLNGGGSMNEMTISSLAEGRLTAARAEFVATSTSSMLVREYGIEGTERAAVKPINLLPLLINIYRYMSPLRHNKELFSTVHLSEDGNAIRLGDGDIGHDWRPPQLRDLPEDYDTGAIICGILGAKQTYSPGSSLLFWEK